MSVNFVLTAFESAFTLSTAAAIPSQVLALTTDATLTLSASVSAATMQNAFFYRTDNPITSDASFVYYYVDKSAWAASQSTLNPKNAVVTSNGYVASDNVSKDFIRDLARQLFGTYLGADMFTNEDSVVTDINSKCDEVAVSIQALISSVDKSTGTLSGMITDGAGDKYLPDVTTSSNISRELFNQLMHSAPSRFVQIQANYLYHATDDGYYRMPILAGDTVTFMLTLTPAAGQVAAVPTGPASLNARTYTVILNVV
jgi:hypothetical protein